MVNIFVIYFASFSTLQIILHEFQGAVNCLKIPRLPTAASSSDSFILESICAYCFKAPTSNRLTGRLKRNKTQFLSFHWNNDSAIFITQHITKLQRSEFKNINLKNNFF